MELGLDFTFKHLLQDGKSLYFVFTFRSFQYTLKITHRYRFSFNPDVFCAKKDDMKVAYKIQTETLFPCLVFFSPLSANKLTA